MKYILIVIIGILIIIPIYSQPYGQEVFCGEKSKTSYVGRTQDDGTSIPSTGTFRILVIYAQFEEDPLTHSYWDNGSTPDDYDMLLDPNTTTNTYDTKSITSYFSEMSSGLYEVIGDEYFYILPGEKSYYTGRYSATRYLLDIIADDDIDYSLYDNWTLGNDHNHSMVPDGIIDHIIVVWRGRLWGTWAGIANLGTSTFTSDEGITITSSKGSTVHSDSWMGMSYVRKVASHEMGHKLIGPHPYDHHEQRYSIWGLLSSIWHSGSCANSYERYLLGWANAIDLTSDVTLNIPDTYSNNVIYRFHPPNGSDYEYYYFENHQKTNIFDDLTQNENDKGIFVLHGKDGYNNTDNYHVHTSEGFFDFDNPFWVDDFWNPGELLPAYSIVVEDKYDQSKKEQIHIGIPPGSYTGDGTEWLHAFFHDGSVEYGGWFRGYNSIFGYSSTGNSLMTPWGNPAATVWNTTASADIAFEVNSEPGGISNVTFYVNDPEDSKPFRPLNVSLINYNGNPKIMWDANIEPDLSKYYIYRRQGTGGTFTNIGNTTNTYFVDTDIMIGPPMAEWYYYVKAKDTQYKYSGASKQVSVVGMLKQLVVDYQVLPNEYWISNNYPNPFNPSTHINYSLPERSVVSLIVLSSDN